MTFQCPKEFPHALRFVRAKRESYLVAVPFRVLNEWFGGIVSHEKKKITVGRDQEEARAYGQRGLNVKRAQAIAEYVKKNREDYFLPPVVVSFDGSSEFKPHGTKGALRPTGTLSLGSEEEPANAHPIDGQHRISGCVLAYRADTSLAEECLPVMLVCSRGKAQDRQAFADINSTSCKVSLGSNVLFNGRDERAVWVQNLEESGLAPLVDFKNPTPKNGKLFCVAGLYAVAKECKDEFTFQTFVKTYNAILTTHGKDCFGRPSSVVKDGVFTSIVIQTAMARVMNASELMPETMWKIYEAYYWTRDEWEGICVFNGALSKSSKLVNDTAHAMQRVISSLKNEAAS